MLDRCCPGGFNGVSIPEGVLAMKSRVWICLGAGLLMLSGAASAGSGRVCLEAETASITEPIEVIAHDPQASSADKVAAAASGGSYLQIAQGKGNPPDMTNGTARLGFHIEEPGRYEFWCRVWWGDECSNSFGMQIDDAAPFTFGQNGTYKRWHWFKGPPRLKQLELAAGEHVLLISNREDGVKLDQVLLVRSRRYVPVGIEEP